MAYSSIGHMGFALVGLAAGTVEGAHGVVVYMAIYLVMTLGTFAGILSMRRGGVYVENISDLAGLARTNAPMAFFFAAMMFSMAGIPPLAGFFAKFYVFAAAMKADLYGLAVIGVLLSAVGAYYYLRIVKIMYFDEPAKAFDPQGAATRVILALSTALADLLRARAGAADQRGDGRRQVAVLNAPDRDAEPADLAFDGWRIERHARLGSTSDEARRARARRAIPDISGFGPTNRRRAAAVTGASGDLPPGNLHASALILDPCETEIAPQIGFVAGVALLRAVRRSRRRGRPAEMAERSRLERRQARGAAGRGRHDAAAALRRRRRLRRQSRDLAAEALPYPTTNLSRLAGTAGHGPQDLFARLARRFDEALALWARGAGFAAIREAWLASAAGLGGPIRVSGPRGAREGVFRGHRPAGSSALALGRFDRNHRIRRPHPDLLLAPRAIRRGASPLMKAATND